MLGNPALLPEKVGNQKLKGGKTNLYYNSTHPAPDQRETDFLSGITDSRDHMFMLHVEFQADDKHLFGFLTGNSKKQCNVFEDPE